METRDVTFNLTEEQINAIKVLIGKDCNTEEQKEEEVPSFPQEGDTYYYLYSDGAVGYDKYHAVFDTEINRLSLGNYFKTKEEAEFEVERLKVLHEMKQFAEPKDYKWDSFNEHHYIYCRFLNNNNFVEIGNLNSCKSDEIYFESEEDAKACIKAVGEDRIKKYYLGIED